jgi:hypothetical protein
MRPGLTAPSRPAWDPNGNNLVFETLDAAGRRNLWISTADGLSQH